MSIKVIALGHAHSINFFLKKNIGNHWKYFTFPLKGRLDSSSSGEKKLFLEYLCVFHIVIYMQIDARVNAVFIKGNWDSKPHFLTLCSSPYKI